MLLVPCTDDSNLSGLMVDIATVQAINDVIETHAVRGHKIRAGAKWETDGDRPSSFFFQKIQGKWRKQCMEGLLDDESLLHIFVKGMMKIVVTTFKRLFASSGPTAAWREAWQRVRGSIVAKVTS